MAALCWLSPLSSQPSSAASRFVSTYDDQIRASVRKFWGDWPFWLDWKAQLYQESTLDPSLCSSVGACGLAQFMPATWADITRQLGYGNVSRHEARYAIEGGAFYMMQLRRQWKAIDFPDRQQLAQASFNAGSGNIRKAQRKCGMASRYSQIVACLADVTGRANARQTTEYVTRIAKWRALMEAGR